MRVKCWFSLVLGLVPWAFHVASAQDSPAASLGANAASGQGARWVEGITEPYWDVMLSSQSTGTVSTQFFKEGDLVQKGQVILELEKKLEELMVQRRKLVVDTLKTDLEGTRTLFEQTKSVSKDDLNKKELEYRVAVVDWETAQEELRRRRLIAPIEGYVTDILIHPGESCRAQEQLVRLVDSRRCYFICHVESKAAYGLRAGQRMGLEIEAGAGTASVQGTISFASPVVDPASGLRKIKVLFDNPEGKIRPGVPGKMSLTPLLNAN